MQRTWGAPPSKPWYVLWAASFAAMVRAAPLKISEPWKHGSAFWFFVFLEEPEKVLAVEGLGVVLKNTQSEPSRLCQPVKSRLLPMTCPVKTVPALIKLSGTSTVKQLTFPLLVPSRKFPPSVLHVCDSTILYLFFLMLWPILSLEQKRGVDLGLDL